MDELLKQAESIGLVVDKRWGPARLQMEVDAAVLANGVTAGVGFETKEPVYAQATAPVALVQAMPATISLEIVRDYWPEENRRLKEGSPYECDISTALRLVEAGIAKRAG